MVSDFWNIIISRFYRTEYGNEDKRLLWQAYFTEHSEKSYFSLIKPNVKSKIKRVFLMEYFLSLALKYHCIYK